MYKTLTHKDADSVSEFLKIQPSYQSNTLIEAEHGNTGGLLVEHFDADRK